ncbi:hypothetical protein [Acuticoccus yangtzensis]|uniref:hypothetical protein n=1 Tax=Acuticoccus yangtzensis TaxID=1443441 RepID=UPI00094991DF|nr:hypothetical protein [Acuticoccus yangtzensis]
MTHERDRSDQEPDRPTTAQLRKEIDSGHTGDKVDHPDPAASPLGTDDEAAGDPPATKEVDEALRKERRQPG